MLYVLGLTGYVELVVTCRNVNYNKDNHGIKNGTKQKKKKKL